MSRRPEILEPIPESINGVEVYDPNRTWYGAALSSFGILENCGPTYRQVAHW